jgi:LysM repeat protein
MVTRKLTGWCFVFLFVAILCCPSSAISQKNEDTAQLSFQKTAISKKKLDTYTVKKGDWIFNIIRQKFGGTEKDILKILKQVKRLNPKIENLHKIDPGQKLILPSEEFLLYERSVLRIQPKKKTPHKKTSELQAVAEEGPTSTYIVKEGDSLSDIIHGKLKASNDDIYQILRTVKRLNPNINNINKIQAGQELLLPFVEKKRDPAETIKVERAPAEAVKVEIAPAEEVKVETGSAGEIKTEDIPEQTVKTESASMGGVKKEDASAEAVKEDHTPFLPGGKIVIPRAQRDVTGKKVVKKQLKKKKQKIVKTKKEVRATEKQISVLRYILSRINGSIIAKGNYFIPLFPQVPLLSLTTE